jgi:hypothetical protein
VIWAILLSLETADHDNIPPWKVVAFDGLITSTQNRYFNGLLAFLPLAS